MNQKGTAGQDARAGSAHQEGPDCSGRGLGRRIMQLRRRRGWDRAKLAELLGIPRERLKKWELGMYLPSVGLLAPLARTLGVSIDELVTGQAPPTPELSPRQKDEAKLCLAGLMRLLKVQQRS